MVDSTTATTAGPCPRRWRRRATTRAAGARRARGAPCRPLLGTVPYHGRVQAAAIALMRFEAHFDPLGQHLRFFTRRSLAATLAHAGFEPVWVRVWGGVPLLRRGLVARASR